MHFFDKKRAFSAKNPQKVWSIQKKAVPLYPLLREDHKFPIVNRPIVNVYGGLSSVGRASDCGSECRGFEPHIPPQTAVTQ